MTFARVKTNLALITLLGFGYLVYDYASAWMQPQFGLTGTVRLQGKPVAKGIVRFISMDPDLPWSFGGYIKDGRYEVPEEYGLAAARYQVEFSSIGAEDVQHMLDARGRGEAVVLKEEIPTRFNQNSEVEIDLSSGTVLQADFDLK